MKHKTFTIPADIRPYTTNPSLTSVTFQNTDPIHALVSMLHFNPLAADPENLCFTYEESASYDDFCNGDRVKRIQVCVVKVCRVIVVVLYCLCSCRTFPLGCLGECSSGSSGVGMGDNVKVVCS